MSTLARTSQGRLLIHVLIVLSNVAHGRKINGSFCVSGFVRFLNGKG